MKKLMVLFLFLFLALPLMAADPLPTLGKVSKFSFKDQNNKPFSNQNVKGQVWIANFVFTSCQGMCPLLTGQMAVLAQQLKDQNVTFVSFSVDPERDTSAVLSEYKTFYQIKNEKWFFVTTSKEETMWDFISKSFQLGTTKATPEDLAQGAEPVMHSSRFVLVDGAGNIRGYYNSQDEIKMDEIVRDASSLSHSP